MASASASVRLRIVASDAAGYASLARALREACIRHALAAVLRETHANGDRAAYNRALDALCELDGVE